MKFEETETSALLSRLQRKHHKKVEALERRKESRKVRQELSLLRSIEEIA
ncbi:MAG TPA: hypothetical protein VLG25_03110 [Patescibacteria group bacterium]|nr:hypothetical protein [Patescibacteria group bacterium]